MKNNLEWTAPEFEYYRKDKSWLVIAGLIAAGLFLWALLTKNIIFALLIGLSYFTVITYGLKKPASVKLAVTAKGIKINQALYEFDNLKSFWIFYELPQIKELSLKSKKLLMPLIKIPLEEQDPTLIRGTLIKFIPEQKQEQSLIDIVAKNIRF